MTRSFCCGLCDLALSRREESVCGWHILRPPTLNRASASSSLPACIRVVPRRHPSLERLELSAFFADCVNAASSHRLALCHLAVPFQGRTFLTTEYVVPRSRHHDRLGKLAQPDTGCSENLFPAASLDPLVMWATRGQRHCCQVYFGKCSWQQRWQVLRLTSKAVCRRPMTSGMRSGWKWVCFAEAASCCAVRAMTSASVPVRRWMNSGRTSSLDSFTAASCFCSVRSAAATFLQVTCSPLVELLGTFSARYCS